MAIKILGVEVDELKLKSIIESSQREETDFDSDFFQRQLDELDSAVEALSKAGPEFKQEFMQTKRLHDSLAKINNWFKQYNGSEKYPVDKVIKEKRLIQVKSYLPNYKYLNKDSYSSLEGAGVFTVADLYIIPFSIVDTNFETVFECLTNVSLKTYKTSSGQFYNPFNLPEDGLYGTSRVISNTHFAVLVNPENNPNLILQHINSNLKWRYIAADGSAR